MTQKVESLKSLLCRLLLACLPPTALGIIIAGAAYLTSGVMRQLLSIAALACAPVLFAVAASATRHADYGNISLVRPLVWSWLASVVVLMMVVQLPSFVAGYYRLQEHRACLHVAQVWVMRKPAADPGFTVSCALADPSGQPANLRR
jgi:hypothetical protein